MNIIFIVLDSPRQDHVSFYGWKGCPVETPNIDQLAQESVVFDNMYPEALPIIPVRTQWLTGQRTPFPGLAVAHRGGSLDRRYPLGRGMAYGPLH